MRFDEKGDKISTVTLYKLLQFSDEIRAKLAEGKTHPSEEVPRITHRMQKQKQKQKQI